MTNKQESKSKMGQSTDEFLVKSDQLVKDLPDYAATITDFRRILGVINIIDGQQKNVRTGVTQNKTDTKNLLIAMSAEYSSKVFAFAKVSDNKPLMGEVNFSISDLGRMTDVSFRTYTNELYKKIELNLEALLKYGISADSQKKFAEIQEAYNNSLVKPRLSVAEKREATKELTKLFIELEASLKKLDAIIGIIRYNEPKFYNGYRTVRKLVNTNNGAVALRAIASDLSSNKPLKGVKFTFKNNGTLISKRTAEKGSFHIRNMNPGTYEVIVRKEGYKEKSVTVNVSEGERSTLKVELERKEE